MAKEQTAQLQQSDNVVFGAKDIEERYKIGTNKAYQVMRAIEYCNGGLVLGKGRVLWSELAYYESRRGRAQGCDKIPTEAEIDDWILSNTPVPGISDGKKNNI